MCTPTPDHAEQFLKMELSLVELDQPRVPHKLSVVVYTYDPSTWEEEAEGVYSKIRPAWST